MAVNRYDTAGNIVNRAAQELGLGKVQDPYVTAAADPNFAQLTALLTSIGQDLVQKVEWRHLVTELLITSDGVKTVITLPSDMIEIIPQSGWNRTTRLPLAGPLTPQQWQALKAWTVNANFTIGFRLNPNELWFITVPPVNTVLAFEYRSNSWVIPASIPPGNSNYNTVGAQGQVAPLISGDVCLFDHLLLTRALKLKWKEEKGFDTTSALKDFEDTMGSILSQVFPAPKLSLNGPRGGGTLDRMISADNLPATGWGH